MTAWMQTTSGRAVDLLAVDLSRIDVAGDIAIPLSRIARFSGQGSGEGPISVAQHCVLGADALLDETGSPATALAFLLHDAHEVFLGDQTTPAVQAFEGYLATLLAHVFGALAPDRIRAALGGDPLALAVAAAKAALDEKIHLLAGLPARLPAAMTARVKEMDIRMLDAERRMGLRPVRDPIGEAIWPAAVREARPVRMKGPIVRWPQKRAADEWLRRFESWRLSKPPVAIPTRRRAAATA